jgi:hypothetical protein
MSLKNQKIFLNLPRLAYGFLALLFLSISAVDIALPYIASAQGTAQYTLYYSESDKKALKAIFDDGEKQSNIGRKMVIAAKGGLFGEKGYNYVFSPAVNDQLSNHGTGDDDDSDDYFAVAPVYCADNKVTTSKPSKKPYYAIDYVLGFKIDNWEKIQNSKDYKTYAGITKVTKINDGGTANEELHVKNEKTGPSNLGDQDNNNGSGERIDKVLPEACRSALPMGDLGDKTRNYWKLSAAEKKEVDKIVEEGDGRDNINASAGDEEQGVECEKGAGVLGWILCPVITNGIEFTNTVYGEFIEPLLENVPISTDPSDGSYKAWQQFRLIGNLMLVATMLAVVYSQLKGGR